jgi:2-phosphoglycerate kinase
MVLLIGGPSGGGKTLVAKQLGLRFGASWLQMDDLRLAFQRSRVTLPESTATLYFFLETSQIWTLPPERLCTGLIEIGRVLSPALRAVIENHVDTAHPW